MTAAPRGRRHLRRGPSTCASSTTSTPPARQSSSSTASSRARCADSRCAASSTSPTASRPRVRLEVGVGAHDRDAFAIIHGDVPTSAALAGVVAAVRRGAYRRCPRAPAQPLGTRAPAAVASRTGAVAGRHGVGAAGASLRCRDAASSDRTPCTALGQRLDGSPVVIVCSVGVDLDVIPYAADARLAAAVQGEAGVELEPADAGSTVEMPRRRAGA